MPAGWPNYMQWHSIFSTKSFLFLTNKNVFQFEFEYLNKGWPTRWHLLHYTLLNIFQTLIRPSSGASEYLLCCVGWLEACWCYVAGLSVGDVDVLTSETCWAIYNKASVIYLVNLYSNINMMHGPIRVRCISSSAPNTKCHIVPEFWALVVCNLFHVTLPEPKFGEVSDIYIFYVMTLAACGRLETQQVAFRLYSGRFWLPILSLCFVDPAKWNIRMAFINYSNFFSASCRHQQTTSHYRQFKLILHVVRDRDYGLVGSANLQQQNL